MIAFLYGGQGSELPRIGADLAEAQRKPQSDPSASRLLAVAGDLIGLDLETLLRAGGPQAFRTEVLQPAMVATGMALTGHLRAAGIRPAFTAGHSLGELTAWAAAGALPPEDAIRAAAFRGNLMARLAEARPGGMLALDGDAERVPEAISFGREHGELSLAAHNGPGAWTLSGEEAALRAVTRRFPSRRVPVAGAWHSSLMREGVAGFRAYLENLPRRSLSARFACNRTGGFVVADETIPELIAGQLAQPVQWSATLQTLKAAGADRFLILGAGKFLRALVRSALGPEIPVYTTETMGDVERALRELA